MSNLTYPRKLSIAIRWFFGSCLTAYSFLGKYSYENKTAFSRNNFQSGSPLLPRSCLQASGPSSRLGIFQKPLQVAESGRVPQLPKRLGFDLPYPLPCHFILLANFLEGS